MPAGFATPHELVEALQHRGPGARGQLWQLLRGPIGRLLDELIARHRLPHDRDRLLRHALHLAETWLRTRHAPSFAGTTWPAFRAAVLLQLAKLASHPHGEPAPGAAGPRPLPESPAYHSQTFFLPHDRVGRFWFGGDWFAGLHHADGSLWVLVADVTGHGYYAYLLASGLPEVWESCWQAVDAAAEPSDLLADMHHLLADCLPDGVFVECTLVRLGAEGQATVVPAGGARLLLRRGGSARPDLLKLRGTWLGLAAPLPGDQRRWALAQGDELLLGTDGLFDQLAEHGDDLPVYLAGPGASPLFDGVRRLLEGALKRTPQKDDITVVLLRRRPAGEEAAATSSLPCNGKGDVSV